MATGPNPIINRIQGHRKQIKGMLTPGLQRSSRDQQSGHLSSIFSGFGGGKIKETTQKMRFLNLKKMGRVQSPAYKDFSKAIPKKFQDVQELLHINPKVNKERTIWSEIEKTLPNQEGGRFEAPPQPGELRRGSVIQAMFPKPGQSTEAFREQVQSRPKPKKPPRLLSKKPSLAPKSRLFSRVQEITRPGEVLSEPPKIADEKPGTAPSESVQRQIETMPELDEPEEETFPAEEEDESDLVIPESDEKDEALPVDAAPKAREVKLEKAQPLKKERMERTLPKPLAKIKSTIKKKKALIAKPSLLQAKPSLSKPAVVQRKADRPAPPKRAESVKPPPVVADQPAPLKKAKPASPLSQVQPPPSVSDLLPDLVQRKQDRPTPKKIADPTPSVSESLPKVAQDDAAQSAPKKIAESPPLDSEASLEESVPQLPQPELESPPSIPLKAEPEVPTASPKMVLRKKIQSRKKVAKKLKSLQPEKLMPPKTPPLLAPQARPIISSDKYRHAAKKEIDMPRKDLPTPQSKFEEALSQPMEKPFWQSDPESVPDSQPKDGETEPVFQPLLTKPLPMSLAYTPRSSQSLPQAHLGSETSSAETSAQQSSSQMKEEQLPPPSQKEEPEEAIIQRLTEGDGGFSGSEVIRRQADEIDVDEPEEEEAELDLDQLAEDVLPLVKRILEIESERLSLHLH